MRGKWFKWRDIPVMVTYHPSYLLRPYNQDAKREAWEDLKKVLHFVYDYRSFSVPESLTLLLLPCNTISYVFVINLTLFG